jgi:hypothetical protein
MTLRVADTCTAAMTHKQKALGHSDKKRVKYFKSETYPSSHHPIIPSSHHPIIPSSHHPIIFRRIPKVVYLTNKHRKNFIMNRRTLTVRTVHESEN